MTSLIVDLNSIASVAYFTDNHYNFFNMINRAMEVSKTDSVVFAADCVGDYWRHKIYPEYKANRKSDPERTVFVNKMAQVLTQANYPVLTVDEMEADDIIASLPSPNWVFTKDRDLWQLWPKSNILTLDYAIVDDQVCLDKFGVKTASLGEFKALRGDPGDNLPGIRGIGDKTAAKLLNQYGSIGNIYAHLNELPKGIRTKLKSGNPAQWLQLVEFKIISLPPVTPKKVTDKFQTVVNILRSQ